MTRAAATPVRVSIGRGNAKTGAMPTLSKPIDASCPASCPMLPKALGGNGKCYANGRISAAAAKYAREYANAQLLAAAIGEKTPRGAKYLRDRVVGDLMTAGPADASATIDHGYLTMVNEAAAMLGLTAYGYTHAWEQLSPADVPAGYVLNASTGTIEELERAVAAGWATTIASDEIADGAVVSGRRAIVCPEQAGKTASCSTCGLCAKGTDSRAVTIIFRMH